MKRKILHVILAIPIFVAIILCLPGLIFVFALVNTLKTEIVENEKIIEDAKNELKSGRTIN